ncbi:LTA synthase family protein [Ureibacillus chungkukjangi]|uniref:Lipoteichoic acid synthase n=1 Tax=Ureibacillus chungkukjangi TaxID=1202712 RepID=A0A318TQH3_9BACL|nr:LTA synthase family protein [Ureibacillus chungkukjangi]MCM3388165.1 LTA synthase family protein [Ureibacillus chungkukjangi]MDI7743990.1 LTA synthase family protein [Lysinibacillus fusiformis]PYF06177.1 lipoteichoic acid synthase [Ureibacillus chungkukjangi]
MNTIIQKSQSMFSKYIVFFITAVIFLWMKTYIVQLKQFNLGVENSIQEFLLFLNPLGSSILILGVACIFKKRKKYIWLIVIDFLLSFLLYANVLYYRFFNDFLTLPTIFQTQNFGDVSSSISSLFRPYDFLFFIDIVVLILLLTVKFVKIEAINMKRRNVVAIIVVGLGISILNLTLAEVDRPQLLTRGFDRNYIVKYLGMYNYTIYDAVQTTKASTQRVLADSDDITEVINFTQANYAESNPEYFGVGKGMNVILVHLESIQEFLIDYKLHDEEVTPFLNSLTREEHTIYFDNFFHQTAQGKTADAEFILSNSLYGLPQGSAFTIKGLNKYHAAPAILGPLGYTSAVFHPNKGSFWNRDEIYKSFGYDNFFDSSYYNMIPEQLADYGLMDKPFYEQSIQKLESLPQPFYSKFITVSHHYPYKMNQEEATIGPHTTGSKSVNNYFQTARYADEALEQFFTYLKESGLYDKSIIIMYGDHYGISQNHDAAMEQVLGKEVTPFVSKAELQRVPLFIRVPGIEAGVSHQYGGQIDILPTILHLLGVETKDYVHFGTDLLSKSHDELVPFRNGDFVSPTITFVDGKFYDSKTGLLLAEEQLEKAKAYQEMVHRKLELSDRVINGDLLRFYTPESFMPVERSQFDYKVK